MKLLDLKQSTDNLSSNLVRAVKGYIEVPGKNFQSGFRVTVPVEGKPSHYVAITLTAVEFIKMEGLDG